MRGNEHGSGECMKEGCGCDMRGMLSFLILWMLSKRSMHGEEMAEEIGRRRGEKPKAGTIYPALKDLKDGGLIKGDKRGKTVVYSLTPSGKKAARESMSYFGKAFGDVIEDCRKMKCC